MNMLPFIIAGIVLFLLVVWFAGTYNHLVGLRTGVEEAFSTMDVFLKKRYDLIPNLVETVKGYAAHESDTLEQVVLARSKAMRSDPAEKIENEAALSEALGRLMVLTENYPNLKADIQFLDLQTQLRDIESEIEKSRRYYNGNVKNLNMAVERVPSNIVAGLCKFQKASFFEIENSEQRENVQVKF